MSRFLAAASAAFFLVLLFLFSNNLFAQSGAPDKTVNEGGGVVRLEYDTNHDGKIDLVVRLDNTGAKLSESIDFNHDPHSSTFHEDQTKVQNGTLVRVMSWYDNEWGFSNRMADCAGAMGKLV